MLHVWEAIIIHGHKFPLVRFALRLAQVVNKVKIAADTINAEVYLTQVSSGPLKEAVVWAKADGRDPIVLEDGAGPHRMQGFKSVEHYWNEIPQSIVDGWIDGFEERRLAVVAARGKHANC
jgi:hypothetical protein